MCPHVSDALYHASAITTNELHNWFLAKIDHYTLGSQDCFRANKSTPDPVVKQDFEKIRRNCKRRGSIRSDLGLHGASSRQLAIGET